MAAVITLAVIVGVLVILAIVAIVMWVRYKRRSRAAREELEKGEQEEISFAERVLGCTNKETGYPWNYRKLKNERLHQTFVGEDNCLYGAQWSGPGTQVLPKMDAWWARHNGNVDEMIDARNFVHPVDRIAMRHDLEYLLAGDEPDEAKRYQMVRDADLAFIESVGRLPDDGLNKSIPLNAMRAKVGAERRGLKQYSGKEDFERVEQKSRAQMLVKALASIL